MRIDSDQKIAGLPATQIRHLTRRIGGRAVFASFVADVLEISEKEATSVLCQLRDEGYVESERHGKTECWGLTVEGRALAMATAARPVKRSTAQRVLREFMARVHQVNRDDYHLYRVTKVVVFGSYLGSEPELGDLDLAIELQPKHFDRDQQLALERERTRTASENGRHFGNVIEQLFWPQQEVRQFLKARKRTISLHSTDDEILKSAPHEVLYEEPRGPKRRGSSG